MYSDQEITEFRYHMLRNDLLVLYLRFSFNIFNLLLLLAMCLRGAIAPTVLTSRHFVKIKNLFELSDPSETEILRARNHSRFSINSL